MLSSLFWADPVGRCQWCDNLDHCFSLTCSDYYGVSSTVPRSVLGHGSRSVTVCALSVASTGSKLANFKRRRIKQRKKRAKYQSA